MFDLTPLRAEYGAKLARRGRWMVVTSLPFFAIWAALVYRGVTAGFALLSPQTAFLAIFLCMPVAFAVIGLGAGRFNSYPRNLTVDQTGATLDYGPGRVRHLLWSKAYSWFELRDETHAGYVNALSSSRYFMAGPSGLYTGMFPIPELAFVRLLEGAREAGVEIVSQTGMGRRMPGAIIYYVKGRRAL